MTRNEIETMLDKVRQAYLDALDGKAVSFTGINGRAVTNHDPIAIRRELDYWEQRYRLACGHSSGPKLANFL
ncbi:hypothetical protein HGT71_05925 [Rosenbergiella epipactidis]|uniref:hypothetical protein n=1 Tax=Rosenbergiella epipactidis TaxID=1544694 RepID=UPI001BD93BC3|nr:hypothetical protein [Rosenbergiella epipactidis]MBT0717810.1 hypothetical protein [Rosenbergiella epipactidis]